MEDLKSTVFYKIIHGELPAYKIYEDEDFLVIMDRYPNNLGHCLILPKIPAQDIFGLDDKCAAGLYPLAKKVSYAVKEATGCDGVNILQNNGRAAGQVVFYFHLHVIPRYHEDNMRIISYQNDFSADKFEDMAEKLRKEM